MTDDDLVTLTVEEVAKALGVRPEAVRIWVRLGRLEAMRWGRRLHFAPEAVRRFQAEAAVRPADARAFVAAERRRGRA